MTPSEPRVGVCVPTLDRAASLGRVLDALACQTRPPDVVVVVDASDGDKTARMCDEKRSILSDLKIVRAPRGLPGQRSVGIDVLRSRVDFICMLDDDVEIEPLFLEEAVAFFESEDGNSYGGVAGYDIENWGSVFGSFERVYSAVGLFDGPLRPGRWLYCGSFLELDRLQCTDDIVPTDFIPGGFTVWRSDVLGAFEMPELAGYALGEDKHFSLRVASRHRVGVLGRCRAHHRHASTGRPRRARLGYAQVRHAAVMLRDCDPRPTLRRYLAFVGFSLLNLMLSSVVALIRLDRAQLATCIGTAGGIVSVLVSPPRRSPVALSRLR